MAHPSSHRGFALGLGCLGLWLAALAGESAIVGLRPSESGSPIAVGGVEAKAVRRLTRTTRNTLASLLWLRMDDYMHSSRVTRIRGIDPETGEYVEKSLGVNWRFTPELPLMLRGMVALNPTFVEAWKLLGDILTSRQETHAEGVEVMRFACEQNADRVRIYRLWSQLGEAFDRVDRPVESVDAYEKARALYRRVLAPERAGTEDFEDSTDTFELRRIQSHLIKNLLKSGRYQQAYDLWRIEEVRETFSAGSRTVRFLTRWELDPDARYEDVAEGAQGDAPAESEYALDRADASALEDVEIVHHDEFIRKMYVLGLLAFLLVGWLALAEPR